MIYRYGEAGDLLAIETYPESEADSPDVVLVEQTEQPWTYTYSVDLDDQEPSFDRGEGNQRPEPGGAGRGLHL
jgi:hypothetical protein